MPRVIGLLGLAAIVGAVSSSFSSSILSAGSMFSWNCVKRLVWPAVSAAQMRRVIRASILFFGAVATVLALKVQSVQALWFFTSDLVFVLLFPQLVFALFDPQANRTGSIVAFVVSFVLRVGGGEPLLGVPRVDGLSRDCCRSGPWPLAGSRAASARLSRDGPLGSAAAAAQRRRRTAAGRRSERWNRAATSSERCNEKDSSPGSSISTPRWASSAPPAWRC